MTRGLASTLVLLVLVACEGDIDDETGAGGAVNGGGTTAPGSGGAGATESPGGAGGNGPTCGTGIPAPSVTAPAMGSLDLTEASFLLTLVPWSGPGTLLGLEVEIYDTKDGAIDDRVWSASFDGPAPPNAIALADGVWDDPASPAFGDWKDYAVRARYRAEVGGCEADGPFSEVPFRSSDGSPYLFDESAVHDFYLTISQASLDGMNAQAYPPGCVPFQRDYYTADLAFEDQVLTGVGVHIKGGCGSSRDFGGKPSLKVDIDWDDPAIAGCPEERRLFGQKHLTLNNGVQDNSAVHERLAYMLFRALDIPAPRMAHARVFVNGQLYGLYQHVESIDRRFLSRWFDSNKGMLYEGTYWCDLVSSSVPPNGTDDYCLTREFSPGACDGTPDADADPEDYQRLDELVAALDAIPPSQFYTQIQGVFDTDKLLTTWAVETMIGHWDGYSYFIMNNYRVYRDPSTNLWTLIDTGVDQTFNDDLAPFQALDARLANSCFNDPACKDAYFAKLKLVRDTFAALDLDNTRAAIRSQIEPLVNADPRKEYDMSEFGAAHDNTSSFIQGRVTRINEHIAAAGYTP
jgi:hypothetical protein